MNSIRKEFRKCWDEECGCCVVSEIRDMSNQFKKSFWSEVGRPSSWELVETK